MRAASKMLHMPYAWQRTGMFPLARRACALRRLHLPRWQRIWYHGIFILQSILVGMIRCYQLGISPILPPACRFAPTCAHYSAAAIKRHGAWRGLMLSAGRILRCHPFHAGGWDPVPPKKTVH